MIKTSFVSRFTRYTAAGSIDVLLLFFFVAFGGVRIIPYYYRLLPPEVRWSAEINAAAQVHGVDPALIAAIIQVESSGDPDALSPAGAMGLMQIMPDTAGDLGLVDPFYAPANVMAGTGYLAWLIEFFDGDVDAAIMAYHGGPNRIRRSGPRPIDREYLQSVQSALGQQHVRQVDQSSPVSGSLIVDVPDSVSIEFDVVPFTEWLARFGETYSSFVYDGEGDPYQGGGRSPSTTACLVQPSRIDNRTALNNPYKGSSWHTREGHGVHGCGVGWPGVDFKSGQEDAILYAPTNGRVTANYVEPTSGNTILVIQNDRYRVVMLHGNYYGVSVGDVVSRGKTVIGHQASIGNSTGPHTHLQVWDEQAGGWIDPFVFFYPR